MRGQFQVTPVTVGTHNFWCCFKISDSDYSCPKLGTKVGSKRLGTGSCAGDGQRLFASRLRKISGALLEQLIVRVQGLSSNGSYRKNSENNAVLVVQDVEESDRTHQSGKELSEENYIRH
jgi:hypothetical protein